MSAPMVNTFFEEISGKLLDLLQRATKLISAPDAIRRADLSRIVSLAPHFGFEYWQPEGVRESKPKYFEPTPGVETSAVEVESIHGMPRRGSWFA